MALLELKHLSKSYKNNKVLDDISLKIEKGDIYGILGLSGAGKSTLLRCINGLETIDDGEIIYHGEVIASKEKRVSSKTKRKIAMIFQSFNLLSQVSVLKNVELPLEITKDKDKKKKALMALEKVGILHKKDAFPMELSGGEKQRVAIARALVLEPEILLSDEATSALDPENTQDVLELLKKLNKELGLTIIMISHQIQVVESISNKVAIIDKQKIVEEGNLSDVFLAPKTEIAKSLVYSLHIKTMLDDKKMIRLLFDGNLDEPLIANIVIECGILVSIVYADTKVIDSKVYGQVVIKLPENKKEKEKLEKYLIIHNVKFEEVKEV